MSGTTILPKRKQKKKIKNLNLAQTMFKHGIYTSKWTEDDAKQYFRIGGLKRKTASVLRTGPGDYDTATEWKLVAGKIEKVVAVLGNID